MDTSDILVLALLCVQLAATWRIMLLLSTVAARIAGLEVRMSAVERRAGEPHYS